MAKKSEKLQKNHQRIKDARIKEFIAKFGEIGYSLIFSMLDEKYLGNLSTREFLYFCKLFVGQTIEEYQIRQKRGFHD